MSNSLLSQFMETLGFSGINAVAGFSGGVVHIFLYKKIKPFDALAALVVGTITSIYACDFVAAHTSMPSGLVGFLIGVLGIQGIAPLVSMLRERIGAKTDEV